MGQETSNELSFLGILTAFSNFYLLTLFRGPKSDRLLACHNRWCLRRQAGPRVWGATAMELAELGAMLRQGGQAITP